MTKHPWYLPMYQIECHSDFSVQNVPMLTDEHWTEPNSNTSEDLIRSQLILKCFVSLFITMDPSIYITRSCTFTWLNVSPTSMDVMPHMYPNVDLILGGCVCVAYLVSQGSGCETKGHK